MKFRSMRVPSVALQAERSKLKNDLASLFDTEEKQLNELNLTRFHISQKKGRLEFIEKELSRREEDNQ